MAQNNINKQELFRALQSAMGNNVDKSTLDQAANGNIDGLMSSLNDSDRAQLQRALADKETARRILNSPAARDIMKSLLGGNKNG